MFFYVRCENIKKLNLNTRKRKLVERQDDVKIIEETRPHYLHHHLCLWTAEWSPCGLFICTLRDVEYNFLFAIDVNNWNVSKKNPVTLLMFIVDVSLVYS